MTEHDLLDIFTTAGSHLAMGVVAIMAAGAGWRLAVAVYDMGSIPRRRK